MASPLRVNIFVENYLAGGLERFYFDLINGLPVNELDITLLTNPLEGLDERLRVFIRRPFNWVLYKNLTLTSLDYRVFHTNSLRPSGALTLGCRAIARLPLWVASRIKLRNLFQRHAADVVHIINGGYPGAQGCVTAAMAAKAAGVRKILMSVQSYPYPPRTPLDAIMDRRLIRAVDYLVPNSLAAAQGLMSLRGFPKSKIHPIQTGTPAPPQDREAGVRLRAELDLPSDRVLVGTVAALEPLKGHLVLLEALREIQAEFPQAHLIFLGEGIMRPQITAYVQAHQLVGRVSLLGYRNDAQRLTNAFDVVAFPSFVEGMPITILEAMALARPIVATNVGGIPEEIEHGASGLLVPPRDSRALADGLRQMLRSPGNAARMGQAAREKYCRQFTVQRMVGDFVRLYSQAEC